MKVIIRLFSVLIVGVLLFAGSCKRCENGFTFELPVTISPAKDTFYIGDTIWIENSFNAQLVNLDNGKSYDMSRYKFMTTITITNLNTARPSYSYPNPKIITYKGTTSNNYIGSSNYNAIGIDYSHENGMRLYKAAFIVDKPGFYSIHFFAHAEGLKSALGNCPTQKLNAVLYTTNNKGDNNYEMLQYAPESDFGGISIEQFNHYGDYCFYVK